MMVNVFAGGILHASQGSKEAEHYRVASEPWVSVGGLYSQGSVFTHLTKSTFQNLDTVQKVLAESRHYSASIARLGV